jgi:(E)-4-hydroxy-3-methylbut-2-enyl-diphosphate synthase
VFIDGQKTHTLRGESIAEEFQEIVDRYICDKYPRRDRSSSAAAE